MALVGDGFEPVGVEVCDDVRFHVVGGNPRVGELGIRPQLGDQLAAFFRCPTIHESNGDTFRKKSKRMRARPDFDTGSAQVPGQPLSRRVGFPWNRHRVSVDPLVWSPRTREPGVNTTPVLRSSDASGPDLPAVVVGIGHRSIVT